MDIFIIETSDSDNINDELLYKFQKKEISNRNVRKTHSLAYLMLDRILRDFYKIENREIVFENKKPLLKTREKYFSISHSREYIAICFSDNDCGIDIEKIIERDYKSIAERMEFECNSLEEFYYVWTKFESDYKLGIPAQSHKQFKYENYIITASCSNENENFEIYIQSGNEFPNLKA